MHCWNLSHSSLGRSFPLQAGPLRPTGAVQSLACRSRLPLAVDETRDRQQGLVTDQTRLDTVKHSSNRVIRDYRKRQVAVPQQLHVRDLEWQHRTAPA